jgi:ribonuclease HII
MSAFDARLRRTHNVECICGVDEAGRGALAGPVVAGAVLLGRDARLDGVNDSKQLSPEEREAAVGPILRGCSAAAVGCATPAEVDRLNVLQATHLAAHRALACLDRPTPLLVTDYLKLIVPGAEVFAPPRADSASLAVAAASILAKVARDRFMTLLDAAHPGYGFARHKGYGTPEHLAALAERGPTPIHRLTFAGVRWFDSTPPPSIEASEPAINWMDLLSDDWSRIPPVSLVPSVL